MITHRMSSRPGMVTLLALALGPLTASAEGDQTLCIHSSTELKSAFQQIANDAVAGSTAQVYRLKISVGTYFPPRLPALGQADMPVDSLEITGGWDGACSTQTINPSNTTLNLGSANDSLALLDIHTRGNILIDGLSLVSAYPSAQSAANDVIGLHQSSGSKTRQYWNIRRSILTGKAAQADATPPNGALDAVIGALDTPPVKLTIENIVAKGFGDLKCAFHYAEKPMSIPVPGHELVFSHSTLAMNGTCAIKADNLDDDSRVLLHNNILALNSGAGLTTTGASSASVELHHNMLTANNAIGAKVIASRGNLATNPLLVSYEDLRPGQGSPAINSGTTFYPAGAPETDLRGKTRWFGSRPDRGAVESAADDTNLYVVSNTNDSGAGSLRASVEAANADAGVGRIAFNIVENGTPVCPAVIPLSKELLLVDDLIVDGFTQPGSQPNSADVGDNAIRCIVLDGGNQGNFGFNSYDGQSSLMVIKGVEFVGFGPNAVAIHASGPDEASSLGNAFASSQFGDGNGTAFQASGSDESIKRTDFASIGAQGPGSKNVFGRNRYAISISRSRPTFVGNISVNSGFHNAIFIFDPLHGAEISRNNFDTSIEITSQHEDSSDTPLRIASNRVQGAGVVFHHRDDIGSLNNAIVEDNELSMPVRLTGLNSFGRAPLGIRLSRNALGAPGLAFSLSGDGDKVRENDNDVIQSFFAIPGNRGQNFPVITAAGGGKFDGLVHGTLSSKSGQYILEMFASGACDATGHGDGEELVGIGSVGVQDDGANNGTAPFDVVVSSKIDLNNRFITATATDQDGNTSEFSECHPYAGPAERIFRDGFEN